MLQRRKVKAARNADLAQFDISGLVGTIRHIGGRQIGNRQQGRIDLLPQSLIRNLGLGDLVLQPGHFIHQGLHVAALLLDHADLLGRLVAARLTFLKGGLSGAAALVQIENGLRLSRQTTARQPSVKRLRVVTDELDIVHEGPKETDCVARF